MKSAFDFWDQNGQKTFQREDVRIYRLAKEDYLFVGQTMYASTKERTWYVRNVLPWAKGNVLEVGLGLGCASKVILANPKVNKLLTIESNESVIAAFGRPLPRHLILLADIYKWAEEIPKEHKLYDLIFVDHYTLEDDQTIKDLQNLALNLNPLLKHGGRIVFWIDQNAPEEDQLEVKKLWWINDGRNP